MPQQWVSAEAHMLSDAKVCSAKATVVNKKVAEEKSALAAYEAARKKKAVDTADAKRAEAKQADEVAKTCKCCWQVEC